jgi:hypothetical protein
MIEDFLFDPSVANQGVIIQFIFMLLIGNRGLDLGPEVMQDIGRVRGEW